MWWRIDPYHLRLTPTTCGTAPAAWMLFPSLFVDPCTITTDGLCLSAVPLLRRHKSDPTVAVPMIVPVHKCMLSACLRDETF